MAEVNLADLEKLFDAGASVTPEALLERGLIRKSALKSVVILGQGELKKSLTVNAHRFSKSAKQKIEAGGKAELIEDRGSKSRIEDRRSKNEGGTGAAIFDPLSSIFYTQSSIPRKSVMFESFLNAVRNLFRVPDPASAFCSRSGCW